MADTELLEYVCAENEKDRVHLVGKNSDDLKNAVKVPPEILSKYVGTYEFRSEGIGFPQVIPLMVTLEDAGLKLSIGGAPGQPMIPLSETSFTGVGGRVEFPKDDSGKVPIWWFV